jgi:ABC-type transport system involved in cytochrome bd biosynthesis fused ATPase/permease subunit
MMLNESKLVIFDEPFAGVDIFTLRDLGPLPQRCFDGSSQTILMFSHRFVLAAYPDNVIVFSEDGSIIEGGSTAEPVRRGDTFAQLHAAAARAGLQPEIP